MLARTRAAEGPVARIKVMEDGLEVTFVNGNTHLMRGMTFEPSTHAARVAMQSVISRIMRDDWDATQAQVDQFFDEPIRIPGMTIDRSTLVHQLRLA